MRFHSKFTSIFLPLPDLARFAKPSQSMANPSILFLFLSVMALVMAHGGYSRLLVPKNHRMPPVKFYEIKKGNFSIQLSNLGATITSLVLPDSHGNLDDVVLGFPHIGLYNSPNNTYYFGGLIGRVANRIGGSRFVLNGSIYHLFPNNGKNSLHGGHRGFNKVVWKATDQDHGVHPYITFSYTSFDGEQGFPGTLDVNVTYKITGPHTLRVDMTAKPLNKATPVNLAQHSYWNLGGHGSGTILDNTVQIFGSSITPVNDNLIPTGEIKSIKGTAYDFLEPHTVGSRINNVSGGYDINYVLDKEVNSDGLRKVAKVNDPKSGRSLELWANQPGLQFYSGNFLDNVKGKLGAVYPQHGALCLETQGFPDSVNHPNFPSQIVNPGEEYVHTMVFKFSF